MLIVKKQKQRPQNVLGAYQLVLRINTRQMNILRSEQGASLMEIPIFLVIRTSISGSPAVLDAKRAVNIITGVLLNRDLATLRHQKNVALESSKQIIL